VDASARCDYICNSVMMVAEHAAELISG